MNSKIIAVDFDGTLCENKWPEIGEPMFGTIAYLLKEKEQGAKLILWTCRVGEMLEKAVTWCAEHGLGFDAVNENLPEIIESFGSDTRKIFANEYLDDRNVSLSVCREKSNMQLWAEREIEIDEDRFHKLLDTIFTLCELSDFHIEERIVIKDKRTGKVWR